MGYSPILGRFLQRDPVGYFGGVDLYEYASSNPPRFLDPRGLQPTTQPTTQPGPDGVIQNDLPVPDGVFRIASTPQNNPAIIQGGQAHFGTTIVFFADPNRCPPCKKIRLVQIVRITTAGGTYKLSDLQKGYEALMTKGDNNGVQSGWIVDFDPAMAKTGAGIFFNSEFPSTIGADGSVGPNGSSGARIGDPAQWSNVEQITFQAQAIAVCTDDNSVLGSLRWGFSIGPNRTLNATVPTASSVASKNYPAATTLFNQKFGN